MHLSGHHPKISSPSGFETLQKVYLERANGIEPSSSAWKADALTVVLCPQCGFVWVSAVVAPEYKTLNSSWSLPGCGPGQYTPQQSHQLAC